MHSNTTHTSRKWPKPTPRWRRIFLTILLVCVVLFVMLNLAVWAVYRGKALPNYRLGDTAVGGTSYAELQRRLTAGELLPSQASLRAGDVTHQVAVKDLGVAVDVPASLHKLRQTRAWLPAFSLLNDRRVPLVLTVDEKRMEGHLQAAAKPFERLPTPSRVIFNGAAFAVADPAPGIIVGKGALESRLLSTLRDGRVTVAVPLETVQAPAPTDLSAALDDLQKQLATKLEFVYAGKTITPTAAQKGAWYVADGQTMVVSPGRVGAYTDSFATNAANRGDLGLAVRYAMHKRLPSKLAVVPAGKAVRSYCTASRNVASADFDDLIGKLALTYSDVRGWNRSGDMAFAHVESGCEYTVWLSAPASMTQFGAICDDYYNCQVGANVIVNDDRWRMATDPWNATGGSIEDYRTLIINHETGHRLGLYDDPVCPAAGQPAPVMMQQSIDLKGCAFNIWPLPSELVRR